MDARVRAYLRGDDHEFRFERAWRRWTAAQGTRWESAWRRAVDRHSL